MSTEPLMAKPRFVQLQTNTFQGLFEDKLPVFKD